MAILVLAAALRLFALGNYPQEFNQDEMVLGYDAWSVWATGKDQHGNSWPIHFQTFNDAVPPVGNYLAAPFVGLLGLTRFNTILPFALLGIATVGLVALLGRRWWGARSGLTAGLLLALDPWHSTYSRVAYPASSVPFFTMLALYAFTRAVQDWPPRLTGLKDLRPCAAGFWPVVWLAISGASFAILMATYTPLKLEASLLIGAVLVAAAPWLWQHWRAGLVWLGVAGLLVAPLLYSQIRYWDEVQIHFKHLSIFQESDWLPTFLGQYLAHYNPVALFWDGYKGGMSTQSPPIGELFWLEGLLWLVAAVGLWRNRQALRQRIGFGLPTLLGLWFLTFPTSSSLTNMDIPHEVRAYNFVPLPELLAGYGAILSWLWLSRLGRRWLAWGATVLAGGLLVVFEILFLANLFTAPLLQTTTPLEDLPPNLGLDTVLERLSQTAGLCDSVWVEPLNQTYMYYLFDTRYPPADFQKANLDQSTHDGGWIYISRFNNIHFGIPGHDNDTAPTLPQCKGQPSRLFFVASQTKTGPEWQELLSVKNAADVKVWRLLLHP